ncbi:MAG: hypothetical protein ACO3P1_05915, partial [Pseudomonadales bacterium]
EITGEFPIAPDDPAYAYDRNPNRIAGNEVEVVLPLNPAVAPTFRTKPGSIAPGSAHIFPWGLPFIRSDACSHVS